MILKYENFLPTDDYLLLREFAERTNDWQKNNSPLWNLRAVNTFNIDIREKEVLRTILNLHNLTKQEIEKNLNPNDELHAETIQFQRTFVQPDQPPHSDSTGNNGEDNGTSQRKFSSLIYLNDQFSGGNLWFPKQNTEIEPKPNTLIIFPATFEYMHGVKAVTSGIRYSILEFWTYDIKNTFCESVLERWANNG